MPDWGAMKCFEADAVLEEGEATKTDFMAVGGGTLGRGDKANRRTVTRTLV